MDLLVLAVLLASCATALAAWRVPGLAQAVFSLLLIAGLITSATLLGFSDRAVPDGDFRTVCGVALLGLLAVAGGGALTTSVFRLIDSSGEAAEGSMRQAGEVLRGGAWIGGLERAAVFVTLVAAWPSGLAIILALKGLGRYAELRSQTPGAAERFIIGTFTSVLWASACAGIALLVLG